MRLLITAVLVMLLANFLRGVEVAGFWISILVAIVLSLLNLLVKPLLIIFTLPVTVLTFGLFLLVINALMIMLCSVIVGGFEVDSFWTALLFSILLSLLQSLVFSLTGEGKEKG